MKLNEIKTAISKEYNLLEGVIPYHLTMTLEQVISDGGITNNVQYFIMGGLISMFKDGGPYRWPRDLNPYSMTTSSEIIDALKTLSDLEAVELASWLLDKLQTPASFESNPYVCPSSIDTVDWIKWVLKKQD
jgi:hypothetical protein